MRREIIPVIGGLELTKVRPGHIRAVLARNGDCRRQPPPRFAVWSVQPCARRSPTGSSPPTRVAAVKRPRVHRPDVDWPMSTQLVAC